MKLLNRQNKIIVTYFPEMKIFLENFFVLTVGENKGGAIQNRIDDIIMG